MAVWLGLKSFFADKSDQGIEIKVLPTSIIWVAQSRRNAINWQVRFGTGAKAEGFGFWGCTFQGPKMLADYESRHFTENTETNPMLLRALFSEICVKFGNLEVDVFASRLNHQLPKYVSWRPDPGAYRVDGSSFNWRDHFIYAFPPFSLIPRTLQKIYSEGPKAIVVVPHWPGRPFFTQAKTEADALWMIRRDSGKPCTVLCGERRGAKTGLMACLVLRKAYISPVDHQK